MSLVRFDVFVVATAISLAGCAGIQRPNKLANDPCASSAPSAQASRSMPLDMDSAPNGEPTSMPPSNPRLQCLNEP
jgi:hypothetical protein